MVTTNYPESLLLRLTAKGARNLDLARADRSRNSGHILSRESYARWALNKHLDALFTSRVAAVRTPEDEKPRRKPGRKPHQQEEASP